MMEGGFACWVVFPGLLLESVRGEWADYARGMRPSTRGAWCGRLLVAKEEKEQAEAQDAVAQEGGLARPSDAYKTLLRTLLVDMASHGATSPRDQHGSSARHSLARL